MTVELHLGRALFVRSMAADETMNGAALAVIRADAAIGAHDERIDGAITRATLTRLLSIGVDDMPASPVDVAILLETLSQRLAGVSRAMVWRAIGVNPNRGRDLLARNAAALDWPIFFTLRHAALTDATPA